MSKKPLTAHAAAVRLRQFGEETGTYGSRSERALHEIATVLAEEVTRLRRWAASRERRDDEIRAALAATEIPEGEAGADLTGLGMTVLAHLDSPVYPETWDPEDRVTALRQLTKQLTDRLTEQASELDGYRALELGAVDGLLSATCPDPGHPTWLRQEHDMRGCPWCALTARPAPTY
ncbi:hypothetical protein [Streptomyces xiamenensis]|uniref:hypothetical protein n=1 Tax=Streptomyces xiamenensis TaxID=408015 RepID=UPI003D71E579